MKYEAITHNYLDAMRQIETGIANGDDKIEKLRCVYTDTDDMIHISTVFDMVDANRPINIIKKFTLYQVIE